MIPKWLERGYYKEPDELCKRLDEALTQYKKVIGNDDITTEPCSDYDELINKINKCAELGIPYHILYKEYDNYDEIEI